MHNIFDLLYHSGRISKTTIMMVRSYCEKWGLSGFHGLLRTHIFTEEELADLIARLLKMERVCHINVDPSGIESRRQLTWQRCLSWECLPGHLVDSGTRIQIVMADPTRRQRIAWFRKAFNNRFTLAVGSRSEVISAIHESFGLESLLPFLGGPGGDGHG